MLCYVVVFVTNHVSYINQILCSCFSVNAVDTQCAAVGVVVVAGVVAPVDAVIKVLSGRV